MEQQAKKPSLFKQRLASSKTNDNTSNGFPQVVKLDLPLGKEEIKNNKKQNNDNTQTKVQPKAFIDRKQVRSILKDQDSKTMNSQNWAKVEAMSEEQRQNSIKSINIEINSSLTSFLQKPHKQQQTKKQIPIKQKEKPKQVQPNQQEDESWQLLLKINIENNQLFYSDEIKQNLISIAQITQMIGSQNNQSQIIGSKIAAKLVDQLIQLSTHKARELVIVNYVPLHLSIIFQRLSFLFFEPMIKRAKNTLFISAFIQITVKIAQILVKVNKYLCKETKQRIHVGLKSLLGKSNNYKNDKDNMTTTIISSLEILCKTYLEYDNKVENQNWQDMKQNADIILQLILLEQAQIFNNSYSVNIYEFICKSTDLGEILSIQRFVYQVINKLILRRNKELYINIQSFRVHWRPIIESIVQRLLPKIVNIELECIFQFIFLARFAGQNSWERIISYLDHLTQIKPMFPHFVLFNTLSDQKGGIREQNIESLNAVLNWLANCINEDKINPNYILNIFIELFLQEEEYYSQLDQQILNKFVIAVVTNKKVSFYSVVSEQKIRSLIKNYGFNSFGNDVFTNLLLFVAIKSSSDLQGMILREAIGKYTNNFISSSKKLDMSLSSLWKNSHQSNKQIKSEILQSINSSIIHQSNNNFLIAYLSA